MKRIESGEVHDVAYYAQYLVENERKEWLIGNSPCKCINVQGSDRNNPQQRIMLFYIILFLFFLFFLLKRSI